MLRDAMQESEGESFGQVLRYWRTQAGRSLRDVEAATGMSATNLSRIERGLVAPPPNFVLDQLAAAVGVARAVLYRAAGRIPPDNKRGKTDVIEAIMADSELTAEQKAFLVQGVRLLRAKGRSAR